MLLLLPFLFIALVIGLIIILAVYTHQKEKERTQQMQALAGQIGWAFAAEPPLAMIPGFNNFGLFSQGHERSRAIRNMLYGEANGVKAAIFDYTYVTGSGKHRQTHNQSVVYLESPNLRLPYFSLRPEGIMHKLFTVFGYQDIDFGQRPEFSKNYLLRGPDEPSIRRTFQNGVLAFYEANQGVCTDGGGNQLLLYREGYRVPPQDVQQYVGWGLGVLQLFPRSW
ncbi:MAG TPA: hypothetical protein VGB17_13625 [Pyrinomonadaceae bacterium]|jgi:hypothetical protein